MSLRVFGQDISPVGRKQQGSEKTGVVVQDRGLVEEVAWVQ